MLASWLPAVPAATNTITAIAANGVDTFCDLFDINCEIKDESVAKFYGVPQSHGKLVEKKMKENKAYGPFEDFAVNIEKAAAPNESFLTGRGDGGLSSTPSTKSSSFGTDSLADC